MERWVENMAWLRALGEAMRGRPRTQGKLFEAAECIEALAGELARERRWRERYETCILELGRVSRIHPGLRRFVTFRETLEPILDNALYQLERFRKGAGHAEDAENAPGDAAESGGAEDG